MRTRRVFAQLLFGIAGFWVGTVACGCPYTPLPIFRGEFTDLLVDTSGMVPKSLSDVTFEELNITDMKATLSYTGPAGSGVVTLDFKEKE